MEIKNCELSDVDDVLSLYQAAREIQQQNKVVVWPVFERTFVEREIKENRQWKIVLDGKIACNWAVAFRDKEIWGAKDKNDAIYLHRICINPAMRGNRYIDAVVEWARSYASLQKKRYVRLDTLGDNHKLIKHYTSAGFDFLGIFRLTDTANLPLHYQQEPDCCLFEMDTRKT